MAYRQPSAERVDEAIAERVRQLAAEIQELDAAIGKFAARAGDGAAAPPEIVALMTRHEAVAHELRELTEPSRSESEPRWGVRGVILLAALVTVFGTCGGYAVCVKPTPSEPSVAREPEDAATTAQPRRPSNLGPALGPDLRSRRVGE